jgi:hypothetical protein
MLDRVRHDFYATAGARYIEQYHGSQPEVTLSDVSPPISSSKDEAIAWVAQVLTRTRGKEPTGNYNALIIGELFWELSHKWSAMAIRHVERISSVSKVFFEGLLQEKCSKDVYTRLSALRVADALQKRCQSALEEVEKLIKDKQGFPITYNHYYTDTIQKKQGDRMRGLLQQAIDESTTETSNPGCQSDHTSTNVNVSAVVAQVYSSVDRDMVHYSCEHLLDCVLCRRYVASWSK